jgi:hypothetical protein
MKPSDVTREDAARYVPGDGGLRRAIGFACAFLTVAIVEIWIIRFGDIASPWILPC